jgi:hypothetical protein
MGLDHNVFWLHIVIPILMQSKPSSFMVVRARLMNDKHIRVKQYRGNIGCPPFYHLSTASEEYEQTVKVYIKVIFDTRYANKYLPVV